MEFISLILVAILLEGVVTYIKTFVVDKKIVWQMLVGLVVGVIVALSYNIDVFYLLGLQAQIPFVGSVLTGILMSRGSNYIFDLVKKLQSFSKTEEIDKPLTDKSVEE